MAQTLEKQSVTSVKLPLLRWHLQQQNMPVCALCALHFSALVAMTTCATTFTWKGGETMHSQ